MPSISSPPVGARAAAASLPRSSATPTTCSLADHAVFFAVKFRNYALFVDSIASYMPAVQTWASALRYTPLAAFKMQVTTFFADAIAAHRRGDSDARDHLASAVVRSLARDRGFEVAKIRTEDYVRLLRYSSLFVILVADE
jgi:hypothetical protein